METKKLRSLPQVTAAWEPGWPQASGLQSLCASLSDVGGRSAQAQLSVEFPIPAAFLPPIQT